MRRSPRAWIVVVALAVSVLAAAPVGAGSHVAGAPASPPPIPPVLSVRDLGPIRQNPVITGRDGGHSALIEGRSIWAFGDTAMTVPGHDGDNWSNNSFSWTDDLDGSDGIDGLRDHVDGTGAPTEFVPLTRKERAYNRLHRGPNCLVEPCETEFALWPAQVVPDPAGDRVLFFYAKIHRTIGKLGWRNRGAGIAVWTPEDGMVRPRVRPGSGDPTLLFGPDEVGFIAGSMVLGQTMYSYGCYPEFVVQHCQVARVPLERALDRAAWRFYAGEGAWSEDARDAVTVLDGGSSGTSVQWDPFLRAFLAIYTQPLANDVMYRVARTPWGPWSDAAVLFEALPGEPGTVNYNGIAHPEYAKGNGRVQYVTYARTTGLFQMEIRQVQVVFGRVSSPRPRP